MQPSLLDVRQQHHMCHSAATCLALVHLKGLLLVHLRKVAAGSILHLHGLCSLTSALEPAWVFRVCMGCCANPSASLSIMSSSTG